MKNKKQWVVLVIAFVLIIITGCSNQESKADDDFFDVGASYYAQDGKIMRRLTFTSEKVWSVEEDNEFLGQAVISDVRVDENTGIPIVTVKPDVRGMRPFIPGENEYFMYMEDDEAGREHVNFMIVSNSNPTDKEELVKDIKRNTKLASEDFIRDN